MPSAAWECQNSQVWLSWSWSGDRQQPPPLHQGAGGKRTALSPAATSNTASQGLEGGSRGILSWAGRTQMSLLPSLRLEFHLFIQDQHSMDYLTATEAFSMEPGHRYSFLPFPSFWRHLPVPIQHIPCQGTQPRPGWDGSSPGSKQAMGVIAVPEAPMGIPIPAGSQSFGGILSDGWSNSGRDNIGRRMLGSVRGMLGAGRGMLSAGGMPTKPWCPLRCDAPIPIPGSIPCIPPVPETTHTGSY